MKETEKSLEDVLSEVGTEVARLNANTALALPRFSVDGALRIVERPITPNSDLQSPSLNYSKAT